MIAGDRVVDGARIGDDQGALIDVDILDAGHQRVARGQADGVGARLVEIEAAASHGGRAGSDGSDIPASGAAERRIGRQGDVCQRVVLVRAIVDNRAIAAHARPTDGDIGIDAAVQGDSVHVQGARAGDRQGGVGTEGGEAAGPEDAGGDAGPARIRVVAGEGRVGGGAVNLERTVAADLAAVRRQARCQGQRGAVEGQGYRGRKCPPKFGSAG